MKDKIKTNLPNSTSYLEIMLLIPEALVAMVIGGKGRQIKSLMDESGAEIIVNQPVVRMNLRSVTVRGAPRQIAQAAMKIYQTLEKFTQNVDNVDKTAVLF